MQQLMPIFELISHILLSLALGYYLASNMQWYNYKISRVIFHHTKYHWHLLFFLVPFFAYYFTGVYFWIYFYFAYLPFLFRWYKKLDRPLVFTLRIKRLFLFLSLAVIFQDILCLVSSKCNLYGVFMPLFFSFLLSHLFEKLQFEGFKNSAKNKISNIKDLKIVAITASYGKTSMKNFLYQIAKDDFITYKTPRSVNTIAGITKDINDTLPSSTQLYIAEAGAREKGDILEITQLLNPQFCIVGKVGEQHLEYFKTLEAIRDTKMELIHSKNLIFALAHESTNVNPNEKVNVFTSNLITNLKSTLNGISFDLKSEDDTLHLDAPILGDFNAENIAMVVLIALKLGVKKEHIIKNVAKLEQVEHRLQRLDVGGKIIIDDSFNGNLEGMLSSYELINTYKDGNKIIVTPGIVESTKEANEKLANKIDEVFDIVILTPSPNQAHLATHIKKAEKIILHSKDKLQDVLLEKTFAKDIVLFSNDTPSYL